MEGKLAGIITVFIILVSMEAWIHGSVSLVALLIIFGSAEILIVKVTR